MTYETKNIIFHVIHVKVSSKVSMFKNFTNECFNRDWACSKMCGKHGRI